MLFRIYKWASSIAVLSFVVALSGCGGGGGGGGPRVGPPPSCVDTFVYGCISRDAFQALRDDNAAVRLKDPEFQGSSTDLGQWGLETLNVHQAHAALDVKHREDPGTGVTIGVMDSGVDTTHGEFAGASITETLLQNLPDEQRTDYEGNEYSHGTAVTSIMAAQPNRAGFVGIAWNADFEVFAVPIGDHLPENDVRRTTFDWVDAYKNVLDSGVAIVNNSYADSGTFIENYEADDLRNSSQFGDAFKMIAQEGVAAADRAIFVWAAGNDHDEPCNAGEGVENCVSDPMNPMITKYNATSPNAIGGAVALLKELQDHNVVVVAVDRDGEIAKFSNRCGIAGRWCIAAPGVDVTAAEFGLDPGSFRVLDGFNGTSFAAPMVTGGLALMKQFFRGELSNKDLVTRLFATANKSGVYDDDSIYGQGLMDLGAAVFPVDELQVTMSGRVGNDGHSIRATHLRLGRAFGDSLSRSLAGREIAAFDALGAPFWFNVSDLTGAANRPSSMARLHSLMAQGKKAYRPAAYGTRMTLDPYARAVYRGGWRFGLYESPANAESSLLNLAGNAATFTFKAQNGLEATAFTTVDFLPQQRTPEMGALLAWRPSDTPFGVRVGWLREGKALLGSTADGAFGRLSANNVFTGFEAATEFGGWRLALDTEIGLVAPSVGGGLIDGLSWLTTSAMSFRASRRLTAHDEITFSLSQPPRIENGSATFTLPVGRTRDGVVRRESFSADLAPSARQIDVAARWRRTGVFGGELQAEAAASHNPGHVAAKPMVSLLAGWRAEF